MSHSKYSMTDCAILNRIAFACFLIPSCLFAAEVIKGPSHNSWSDTISYAAFFDYSGDYQTDQDQVLSSGAQDFVVSFGLQATTTLDLSQIDLANAGTSTTWLALGTGANEEFWGDVDSEEDTSSLSNVYIGFNSLNGEIYYFNQYGLDGVSDRTDAATKTTTSTGVFNGSANIRFTFSTDASFRSDAGTEDLEFGFTAEMDLDRDGNYDDLIYSGNFEDSRWGVNFWLGSDYYYWDADGQSANAPTYTSTISAPLESIPEAGHALLMLGCVSAFTVILFSVRRSRYR